MIALQKLKAQKFIDDHTSKVENTNIALQKLEKRKCIDDRNPKWEKSSIFCGIFQKVGNILTKYKIKIKNI